MGLLDSDLSLMGLGLLNAAGPSPLGVRQGIGAGLLAGRSLIEDARKSRTETRKAQLEEEKMRLAMEQARQEQIEAQRQRAAMEQWRASLPPELQSIASIAPGAVAQGLLGQMMPKQGEMPTSFREYELARANGYTGSYQDFMTQVKRSPPVNVNVGGESEKPISATDLDRLRKPDGTAFPFGTTPSQAAAQGAVVVPGEQRALQARGSEFNKNTETAMARFAEISKAWESDQFNPALRQQMSEATASLEAALAQENNPTGEPSDVLLKKFNVPGMLYRQIVMLFSGKDPAAAYRQPARANPLPATPGQQMTPLPAPNSIIEQGRQRYP